MAATLIGTNPDRQPINSSTVTFSSRTLNVGDVVCVAVSAGIDTTNPLISSFSGSNLTSWTKMGNIGPGGFGHAVEIWYAVCNSAGSSTIGVTPSTNLAGYIWLYQGRGCSQNNLPSAGTFLSNTTSITSTISGPAGSLVITAVGSGFAESTTPGSPFVNDTSQTYFTSGYGIIPRPKFSATWTEGSSFEIIVGYVVFPPQTSPAAVTMM